VKVSAVTVPDAASDSAHPDHDRWVKDRTLAMEAKHAAIQGRTYQQAEQENAFWLARAEARARGAKDAASKPTPGKRKMRDQRLADRPVAVRPAEPEKVRSLARLSPCGRCGICRCCKREKRVLLMTQRAKAGEMKYVQIMWRLSVDAMHAQTCSGKFRGMRPGDANRKLMAELEDICDATVIQMGPWR
jgi:hypothetical protein